MPGKQPIVLTVEQLEQLLEKARPSQEELEAAVQTAVVKALISVGISAEKPISVQKDFAFLRSLRIGSEGLRSYGLKTAIGMIVTALGTLIYLGCKAAFAGSK